MRVRHLIYHPESDCLFTVWFQKDLEAILETGQCSDVTGEREFELQYVEQERSKTIASYQLRKSLHESLIKSDVLPSCVNCLWWGDETCTHYHARPPAKVIVISCGEAWEPDIPF